MSRLYSVLFIALASPLTALPEPISFKFQKQGPCSGNTPTTRDQWCGFDIHSDYYSVVPDTGVTREYWLEISEITFAPDGVPRFAQAINGTIPGPTIFADWGDNVVVHMTSNLKTSSNGSSFHFHGTHQNYTNPHDGVVAITQCPVAPGFSVTYRWRATQYGTSWYHSHFGLQTYDGVYGGLIIRGPTSANYEEDVGTIMLSDWSHKTVNQLLHDVQREGPALMDNVLINGTNVYGNDTDKNQTGERFRLDFEEGKTYRLRLINTGIDTLYKFSIDHHTLKVIAVDFVSVEPYETDHISLAIGERMDILVTANQASRASSFWLRAIPQLDCTRNVNPQNALGIVSYASNSTTPTTKGRKHEDHCQDEPYESIVPVVPRNVKSYSTPTAALNSTTMIAEWGEPSLLKLNNSASFTKSNAVIRVPKRDVWVYLAIETEEDISHPIHLHGFDFQILDQGPGPYNPNVTLNTENPPRRDTALLPAKGHLVIAFLTDNPEDEIPSLVSDHEYKDIEEGCRAWNDFSHKMKMEQDDSGI
ncbi:Laccase-2 [Fusarium oxysporum f. sp. cubense race 1]|uniref:Laccase-2 n=1 Tax=Fusarium oxysporum f. sp. cubense (strain race 1) TaxID=1229664 RepID=N4UR61_FUSC1|nr:Laccase-2 [Fusarium oxysporum f. sp. cubense race 1]